MHTFDMCPTSNLNSLGPCWPEGVAARGMLVDCPASSQKPEGIPVTYTMNK